MAGMPPRACWEPSPCWHPPGGSARSGWTCGRRPGAGAGRAWSPGAAADPAASCCAPAGHAAPARRPRPASQPRPPSHPAPRTLRARPPCRVLSTTLDMREAVSACAALQAHVRRADLLPRPAFLKVAIDASCPLTFPVPGDGVVVLRSGLLRHIDRHAPALPLLAGRSGPCGGGTGPRAEGGAAAPRGARAGGGGGGGGRPPPPPGRPGRRPPRASPGPPKQLGARRGRPDLRIRLAGWHWPQVHAPPGSG